MEMYQTKGLTKIYGNTENSRVVALDHVDLSIEEGEFVAVMGRSGSGKSTLLHMLGAVDEPSEGEVFLGKQNVFQLKDRERTILRRRRIGFIFQNYNLVPEMTIAQNILLPLKMDRRKADETYMEQLLEKLGILERKDFYPGQLSGGQQQRVAIARALITKPAVILADEPTGNLDADTGDEVMALLKRMAREYHQTLVVVTHDKKVAQMANRIVRLKDGRIVTGLEE